MCHLETTLILGPSLIKGVRSWIREGEVSFCLWLSNKWFWFWDLLLKGNAWIEACFRGDKFLYPGITLFWLLSCLICWPSHSNLLSLYYFSSFSFCLYFFDFFLFLQQASPFVSLIVFLLLKPLLPRAFEFLDESGTRGGNWRGFWT